MRTFNRTPGEVGDELRARALSAIEKMPGMNQSRREGATKIIEEFDNDKGAISRMCLLTSTPAYLRAFAKAARGQENQFTPEEREAVTRAMSLTDNAGGYLVPFQLDPTVIITSAGSLNEIRRAARQVVATGDVWNGVSAGETSWSWDAEASEASDDTSTFAQPAITVRKAVGFVPISIEALQDEQNVAGEVGRLLTSGKETLEATAFATGASGSGEPIGIVTALTGGSSVVASATTDTFAIADVYALQGALPARYRANASWLANNLIYNRVRQFDTAGGAGLWERIGNDRPAELVGRSAYEAEAMDGSITALADNLVLIFGDFSNYVIADRVGMTVEFIPHLFHTDTNLPSGQRGWYAYYRVGADSVNDGAFRMLNVT
jgi:HK97 family phage major capsid protein